MHETPPVDARSARTARARELNAKWEAMLERDLARTPTVRDELTHQSADFGFKEAFADLPNQLPVWLQYTLLAAGFALMAYLWIVR